MKTTRTLVPGMLFQLGLRRPRPQSIMRNTSVLSWRLLWASSFFIGQAVLPELRVGLWGVGVPKLETHIYSLGSRPCGFQHSVQPLVVLLDCRTQYDDVIDLSSNSLQDLDDLLHCPVKYFRYWFYSKRQLDKTNQRAYWRHVCCCFHPVWAARGLVASKALWSGASAISLMISSPEGIW